MFGDDDLRALEDLDDARTRASVAAVATEIAEIKRVLDDCEERLGYANVQATLADRIKLLAQMITPEGHERLLPDEAMLRVAEVFARRSTCTRRKVGAIITDMRGLTIVGIGYNGNARGLANACDRPDDVGHCGCIHAEANALLKAPGTTPNLILYTTCAPCLACAKLILNSGVYRVVYRSVYRSDDGVKLLRSRGLEALQRSRA